MKYYKDTNAKSSSAMEQHLVSHLRFTLVDTDRNIAFYGPENVIAII